MNLITRSSGYFKDYISTNPIFEKINKKPYVKGALKFLISRKHNYIRKKCFGDRLFIEYVPRLFTKIPTEIGAFYIILSMIILHIIIGFFLAINFLRQFILRIVI